MENFSQCSFADHFLRQRDRRDAPVIVADHVDDFGFLHGGQHRLGLFYIQRQRLFAQNVFPVSRGGDGNLRVQMIRRADVHNVNQWRLNDFLPVFRGVLPAELRPGRLHACGIASANGMQFDIGLEIEEMRRLPPGIRVRLAHEAVADQPNAKSSRHKK